MSFNPLQGGGHINFLGQIVSRLQNKAAINRVKVYLHTHCFLSYVMRLHVSKSSGTIDYIFHVGPSQLLTVSISFKSLNDIPSGSKQNEDLTNVGVRNSFKMQYRHSSIKPHPGMLIQFRTFQRGLSEMGAYSQIRAQC